MHSYASGSCTRAWAGIEIQPKLPLPRPASWGGGLHLPSVMQFEVAALHQNDFQACFTHGGTRACRYFPGAQSPSTLRNVTRDLLHSTSTVYSGRCHISHSPDIWAYFGGGRRQRAGGCSWGKNFTAVIKLFSITGLLEQSLYWKLLCVLIYRSE